MTAAKILEIKVQASKLQETLGLLAETQEQLNAVSSALEKATEETKKSGSMLSKAYSAVCKKMKEFALTIKKGVLGGLKDSLKVARNLVMALGAAAAASIAISSGSIKRDREAKDSKVTASQLLAYQYAQEQTGMNESEFNLANLQAKIHDIGASGDFANIGLRREDLVGLNGFDAMQKAIEAVRKLGGSKMTDAQWAAHGQSIENLMGVSAERKHLFSDKTQKEFNKEYQWGLANGIDNDTLMKGEKAWNKFKFTLNKVGTELAAIALPAVIKGLDKLSIFIHDIVKWIKSDAGKNASEILEKLVSGIIDLSQKALPYFLAGLDALGGIIKVINETLSGGPLGKALGKIIDSTVGYVTESLTKVWNVFDPSIDITNGQYYHRRADGSMPTEEEADAARNKNMWASPEARYKDMLLNKVKSGKATNDDINKLKALLSGVKIEINNYANADGSINSKVASKMGGY